MDYSRINRRKSVLQEMGAGAEVEMEVGMVVPPPETEADVPPPLDEHHPLAVEDLKDNHPSLLREVSEKKVS